jgi:hypothetical protein
MPLLSVVAAVAIVGGMSSTLAGTITLNGGGTGVEFGQGVVTAAACDTSISIFPTAQYDTNTASSFKVSTLKIANLGLASGTNGNGCKNKRLTIRAYALNSNTALDWTGVNGGTTTDMVLDLPDSETLTSTLIGKGSQTFSLGTQSAAYASASTTKTQDTGLDFTIEGLAISSDVVRFTVESSDKP